MGCIDNMAFLGTRAGSSADLALIFSIIGFIILFIGVLYAKRRVLQSHFEMARLAVGLTVIAFIIRMAFSLIRSFQLIISHLASIPILITVLHVIFGTSALITGIFLAFDTLIKKSRYPMITVFLLWIFALLLGIITYIMRYVTTRPPG
jgi:uncharacterized membrane protein YozB (DUF420 family)